MVFPEIREQLRAIQTLRHLTNGMASDLSGIPLGTYVAAVSNGVMGKRTLAKCEEWIKSNERMLKTKRAHR